jgi:hypothetical protein
MAAIALNGGVEATAAGNGSGGSGWGRGWRRLGMINNILLGGERCLASFILLSI